jgi:hypothetical protein
MKVRDQRQEQLRDFGELFDITARRHKGNEQSTAAFHVIKDKISASRERILNQIRQREDGLTCDELAVMFSATPNEISGRCSELKRDGKIYKSGTRKTRSGCSAAILKSNTRCEY